MTITDEAYYVGTNPYSFRKFEPARIVGVLFAAPNGSDWRLCYEIQFSDGVRDLTPIDEKMNYELFSFNDILNGNHLKSE